MATSTKHLHRLLNSAIVLPLLLAALLGLGLRGNATLHTTVSASHSIADVDAPPPGH
jgi:hypothetical protein